MHLIDKYPRQKRLKKTSFTTALKNKVGSANSKYTANTLLRQNPRDIPKLKRLKSNTPRQTPTMKQYGDKGYSPSTGKGVGY